MFLSIVTVTLNCRNTIERTIQSVISQLSDNMEYIVIDGDSNDGTKEVIEKYSEYIAYWKSEKDNGIYDAMNKGIEVAKGDWIAFINGNDWYFPEVLFKVEKIANFVRCPILYGYVNAILDGQIVGYIGISEPVETDMIYFGNQYCHQGLFIKRKMFEIIGKYNTEYKVYADHDWNIRAHKAGYDPYILGFTVANYTMGGVSSIATESDEVQRIIIKNYRGVDFISHKLKKLKGRADFVYLAKTHSNIFSLLFSCDKKIILWGIGYNGLECYKILLQNGISPFCTIVTNPECDCWYGIRVISSNRFFENVCEYRKLDYFIIVSSDKYEDEIEKELINHGINRKEYMKMTELYKWSYEHNIFIE